MLGSFPPPSYRFVFIQPECSKISIESDDGFEATRCGRVILQDPIRNYIEVPDSIKVFNYIIVIFIRGCLVT